MKWRRKPFEFAACPSLKPVHGTVYPVLLYSKPCCIGKFIFNHSVWDSIFRLERFDCWFHSPAARVFRSKKMPLVFHYHLHLCQIRWGLILSTFNGLIVDEMKKLRGLNRIWYSHAHWCVSYSLVGKCFVDFVHSVIFCWCYQREVFEQLLDHNYW